MRDIERLMLECRYILSINKSFNEIASYLEISEKIVYDDIYVKLPKFDRELYFRVKKTLKYLK